MPPMPRRKWIIQREWVRCPHADSPPPNVWWYHDRHAKKSRKVVRLYLRQVAKGRTLDKKALKDLKADLYMWLDALTQPEKISPQHVRRTGYWTLPAYALRYGLNKNTFLKRVREMDKIARRLYPDRVPLGLQEERKHISEKTKRIIVAEYKKIVREIVAAGESQKFEDFQRPPRFRDENGQITKAYLDWYRRRGDWLSRKEHGNRVSVHHLIVEQLAGRFGLPTFRIGQICRKHRVGYDGKRRFPRTH